MAPSSRSQSYASVVSLDGWVFVEHWLKDEYWLKRLYAITEGSFDPPQLGASVRTVLYEPWPDIYPKVDLMEAVLAQTGISSNRRFVARSNYVGVGVDGDQFTVTPWKPDGVGGYRGVKGAPTYTLVQPADYDLGASILRALKDSANFPNRPRIR